MFVETRNVQTFLGAMREAEGVQGEPTLLVFHGQAGRGKTTAARYYAAQRGWTYVRALSGWSELWMLQDLCFELQVEPLPHRKKPCFEAIRDRLLGSPRAVVVDEADKLTPGQIEWIRDLADLTFVPWALVGEKVLLHKMERERRVWSRTLRAIRFQPITAQEILFAAKRAADIQLTASQAEEIRKASDGDFRLATRNIRLLENLLEANKGTGGDKNGRVSDELVKTAIKQGFRGN